MNNALIKVINRRGSSVDISSSFFYNLNPYFWLEIKELMVKSRSIYIAFEAFPRPKGTSSHIASMIKALERDFAPVLLLCLGYGDMPAYQKEGDIYIRRYKAYHPNMLKRSQEFSEFVEEQVFVAGPQVELIIFRDPWGGCPALSASPEVPSVFEVNGLPSWELKYTYPSFEQNYALKNKIKDLERFCLKNSHAILTVSSVTRKALVEYGVPPDKITTLPNSAPDCFFKAVPNIKIPEKLLRGRWIGYFGSLHSWQGINRAVDAFALVHSGFEDVNMMIVTQGKKSTVKTLKKRIRKMGLEERVIVYQALESVILAETVRHFEFTLAPLEDTSRNTIQGCCPIKIIESMATGVPVIASDLKCVSELITHDFDGVLVRSDSTRALAVALNRLLSKRLFVQTLGENARNTASKRFKRSIVHGELNKFFIKTCRKN